MSEHIVTGVITIIWLACCTGLAIIATGTGIIEMMERRKYNRCQFAEMYTSYVDAQHTLKVGIKHE